MNKQRTTLITRFILAQLFVLLCWHVFTDDWPVWVAQVWVLYKFRAGIQASLNQPVGKGQWRW